MDGRLKTKEIDHFVAEGHKFSLWQMPNKTILFLKNKIGFRGLGAIVDHKTYRDEEKNTAAAEFDYLRGKLLGHSVAFDMATDDDVFRIGLEAAAAQYELFGER